MSLKVILFAFPILCLVAAVVILYGESRWMPFTSTQRVVNRRPGFDWDARISFSSDGLIDTVLTEARGGTPGMSTPWQCRVWNYAIRDGMRVPLEAEAAWMSPEGAKLYWRGLITKSSYEFAR